MTDSSLRLLLSATALFIFATTTFAQKSPVPANQENDKWRQIDIAARQNQNVFQQQGVFLGQVGIPAPVPPEEQFSAQNTVKYQPRAVAPERKIAIASTRQQGQCTTIPLNVTCATPRSAYSNHRTSCTNCGGVIFNGNCSNNNCFVKNGSRRLPLHPQGLRYQDTAVTQDCQHGACFHGHCLHGSCPLVCQTQVCEKARAAYLDKYNYAMNHQHDEACQFGTCQHGNCPLLCPNGNCPFVRFRSGIGQNTNVYSGEVYDSKGNHVGYTQGGRIYDLDGNPMGVGQNVNVYNGVVYNTKGAMVGFSRNGSIFDSKGN
ncbi:MAG: hypothetical protein LBU65_10615, partial [Planctomycetaceae bacterium]|nr:hypothetical protein [Planctomycetaceae bacterium]